MNPKLKEALPKLSMERLSELDRGAVERRVNAALALCLSNISQFPFRDGGKVETRKVLIEVQITPEIKAIKIGVEGKGRQQQVEGWELEGVVVRVKVKSALPDAETADVRCLCEIRNNQITDVRFNPDNSDRPEQLDMLDAFIEADS